MSSVHLPAFLEVKETVHSGRGIFTRRPIQRGQRIVASRAHAFGVGGVTAKDVRTLCHHCLVKVDSPPLVCKHCRVVGYCSKKCQRAAQALHALECGGILELEKRRPKHEHSLSTPNDCTECWPPIHALMVARIINKQILANEKRGRKKQSGDWISFLSFSDKLPQVQEQQFSRMKRHVPYLVPSQVSQSEIDRVFCAVGANAATISSPQDTSAVGLYVEYSLLNHMCKPNCGWEEKDGAISVFAFEDIKVGDQLGISYLLPEYCLYLREVRRKELVDVFGFNCCCDVCLGEETVGSDYWLLDRQKRAFITPWSSKMVEDVMDRAWEVIRPHRFFTLPPSEMVQILEQEVKVQQQCLEKTNVIRLLTVKTLIGKYGELGEMEKAVDCFLTVGEDGMNALVEYGIVLDATEVIDTIGEFCLQLGRMEECHRMAQLMKRRTPKRPSAIIELDEGPRLKHKKGSLHKEAMF